MNPLEWLLSLTDHQLNVLATVFGVMASSATVFSVAAANYARLARRDARVARENTQHTEYANGAQRAVSVTDYARHAAEGAHRATVASAAARQETADLGAWVRGNGRRRQPTTDVPTISRYTGAEDE